MFGIFLVRYTTIPKIPRIIWRSLAIKGGLISETYFRPLQAEVGIMNATTGKVTTLSLALAEVTLEQLGVVEVAV